MHPQYPDQPENFNRRAYMDVAVKIYGGYAPTELDVKMDKREVWIIVGVTDISVDFKGRVRFNYYHLRDYLDVKGGVL